MSDTLLLNGLAPLQADSVAPEPSRQVRPAADLPEKAFVSHAPGYWRDANVSADEWNSAKWQLKNRVTTLEQLEQHLVLSEQERAGVLLSGNKLAMAITPHFFNLIHPTDPDCPIRRQVIPRIEETWEDPTEMADPCGEDANMPVPGLVHRYPDRVLFLVTDRCAAYCRYCSRSRVVSGSIRTVNIPTSLTRTSTRARVAGSSGHARPSANRTATSV
jgi:hypothetical protein